MDTNPVFVALDTDQIATARRLAGDLASLVGGIKLGLEFFAANGPVGVNAVVADSGLPLFLDLKLHDIPNTVAGAIAGLLPMRPAFLTLHAAGGPAMLHAAVAAADRAAERGLPRPALLAVTVLTSLGDDDLTAVGQQTPASDQVRRLAALAQHSGVDGVVCSGVECAALRADLGPDFTLMVPGIRPDWAATDDQKRILTPRLAMAQGASWLVIGRPITGAADPAQAARRIRDELAA